MIEREVYCPSCNGEGLLGREHVTPEMAQDAGDPSLEGQPIDHLCDTCGGGGFIVSVVEVGHG